MGVIDSSGSSIQKFRHPENFMWSPKYGALIQDAPIAKEYPELNRAGKQLPEVFGTEAVYPLIESLPKPNLVLLDTLSVAQQYRVAKRCAFLASAWLKNHSHGKPLRPDLNYIPSNLARLFVAVCEKLGRKHPILSYDLYCKANWELIDPNGPFEIKNLRLEQCFVNPHIIPDESGFILIHTVIDKRGKYIPEAAAICLGAIYEKYHFLAASTLRTIAASLSLMYAELIKMPNWCDPNMYYLEVRPQIQLFQNIRFEGVENPRYQEPITLRGETGAQSTLLELIRVFLGIPETTSPLTYHRREMREYMVAKQIEFIDLIAEMPSVREYVIQHWQEYPGLRDAYNACVHGLYLFLREHLKDAIGYIEDKETGEKKARGTGGTPFRPYLQLHLWEVRGGRIYANAEEELHDEAAMEHLRTTDPIFSGFDPEAIKKSLQ
ncbi:MAG: hypothetical protein Q7R73_03605 [bacterium]|nr:hypothetical protein [bacterium]